MKKLIIINAILIGSFATANSSNFCANQAIEAAKGLAAVNGSVAEHSFAESNSGLTYIAILSDKEILSNENGLIEGEGQDFYTVETSGGHDCTITSVKINGGVPTRIP